MLVHKGSLGVLEWVWEGDYQLIFGVLMPVLRHVKSAQEFELDPAEWWEVGDPALCGRIRRCYPDFLPVCDNEGELVDIQPIKAQEESQQVPAPVKQRKRSQRKSTWEVISMKKNGNNWKTGGGG